MKIKYKDLNQWHAGTNDSIASVGPHKTREAAIKAYVAENGKGKPFYVGPMVKMGFEIDAEILCDTMTDYMQENGWPGETPTEAIKNDPKLLEIFEEELNNLFKKVLAKGQMDSKIDATWESHKVWPRELAGM
jgi:hypothetical protein